MSKKSKYPNYIPKNKKEEEEAEHYFNNGGNPDFYNEQNYKRIHSNEYEYDKEQSIYTRRKKNNFWSW